MKGQKLYNSILEEAYLVRTNLEEGDLEEAKSLAASVIIKLENAPLALKNA